MGLYAILIWWSSLWFREQIGFFIISDACSEFFFFSLCWKFCFSCCSKVTVSLRYADLVSVLPTRIRVLAWPSKKSSINAVTLNRKENGVLGSHQIPARLSYAEDALRTMSLPEGVYCYHFPSLKTFFTILV